MLAESLVLVLIVIFAFVGSVRATIIPAVTIPVAIISAFIVMAALDYTINTLTLLGTRAGHRPRGGRRHRGAGKHRPADGARQAAAARRRRRQPGDRLCGRSRRRSVLVAVFVPISFMPGNLGRLFGEFGISLAAAIAFSGLVALTLVPMLTSKFFANGIHRGRLARRPRRVSSSA